MTATIASKMARLASPLLGIATRAAIAITLMKWNIDGVVNALSPRDAAACVRSATRATTTNKRPVSAPPAEPTMT